MELNKQMIINSAEKCLQNARELFDEAEILRINNKFARAYLLYYACNEEIGKIFVTFQYLIQNNYSDENMKKFLSEFRSHNSKIKTFNNIMRVVSILIQKELLFEQREGIILNKENLENLNKFKSLSIHSFIGNNGTFKPSDIIGLDEVNTIRVNSELFLSYSERFCRSVFQDVDKFISITKEF